MVMAHLPPRVVVVVAGAVIMDITAAAVWAVVDITPVVVQVALLFLVETQITQAAQQEVFITPFLTLC
jgi:hypothetical protein